MLKRVLSLVFRGWRRRALRLGLIVPLAFPGSLCAADVAKTGAPLAVGSTLPADPVADLITFSGKYTTIVPPLVGPYDPNVASLTARMLKGTHYTRHPLDGEMAERFLHRYCEMLDPLHLHFLQSDIEEFGKYRDKLPELTAKEGDTAPAGDIYTRFLQRVDQRVEFVAGLLREEQFDFTGNDRYTPNRKDAAWPKDLAAAKLLWQQHLRYEYLQEKLNKRKPEQILKTLTARYKRLLKSWGELDGEEVLEYYLTSLAQAYDPHSDYMGKAQLENFAISMKLSLFGIGALLGMEDDYCKIESLVAGGPAAKSKKIKPNDKIIAVQQKDSEPVDVVGWKLTKIVELIRGPKNTEVTLTFIPADAPDPSVRKTITLVRDEIKLEDQEAKAKIIDLPDTDGRTTRLGVIDLPSFYASFDVGGTKSPELAMKDKSTAKSTSADVTCLIKKLMAEKVGGIILDLRRNGGGSLEEAIRLTGLFIRQGPIVQVKDANGDIIVESDPDPEVLYDGPLLVLTSRFSASASEILAAALQDYGRALIVGDSSTHGKGTVQTIYELSHFRKFPKDYNPGALKVTIRKFYRANGESTQLRGVTPDIVLPSLANYMEVGESSLEFALPWDTIPSASFDKLNRVQPFLDELRRRTEARQAVEKDFAYLREDIDLYRKMLADKSVSLNEAQRLKEKQEADARLKARKEERKARVDSKATVYEVPLKLADAPGLPPPLAQTNEPPAKVEGEAVAKAAEAIDSEDEEKAPVVDVTLDEAKRILIDFLLLSSAPKSAPVTVSK